MIISEAVAVTAAGCTQLGGFAAMVKVECASCSGARQVFKESHECRLLGGRCIPEYQPPDSRAWRESPESQIYRLCAGCDRFEASG